MLVYRVCPVNENAKYTTSFPPLKLENWLMGKASLFKISMALKSSNTKSLKKM
jgi:hypothetical protein